MCNDRVDLEAGNGLPLQYQTRQKWDRGGEGEGERGREEGGDRLWTQLSTLVTAS